MERRERSMVVNSDADVESWSLVKKYIECLAEGGAVSVTSYREWMAILCNSFRVGFFFFFLSYFSI